MPEIDIAYLPIVGRGEQINIVCAMHGIKVNLKMSKPMGCLLYTSDAADES